ncbi:Dihem cytochrome c [compost metagenome]
MKHIGIALLLGLTCPLVLANGADSRRPKTPTLSADASEMWRTECGSCHMAYPPGLLPSEAWRQHMDTLSNHFGKNASLDPREEQEIRNFLLLVSSNNRLAVADTLSPSEQPRITATHWFKRKHRKVRMEQFALASVGIPGNCVACHSNIENGTYRKTKIPR